MSTWITPAAAAATALLLALPAQASITINVFDTSTANAYMNSFDQGQNTGEDFEALGQQFGESEFTGNGLDTSVGTFSSIGGKGTGGTVKKSFDDNTGTGVALRTGSVFGRENQIPLGDEGDWFLDSNDTQGIEWDAGLDGKMFDRISFVIQDAGDQGAWVTVSDGLDNEKALNLTGSNGDGNVKLVEIVFDTAVSFANIRIENFRGQNSTELRVNDGLGLDGAQISAVPLPPAVLLLGLGVVGLAGARRLQTRRKDA